MKLYVLLALIISMFAGCGAMNGTHVKDHNLLAVFDSNKNRKDIAEIVYDMSRYCGSGLYLVEKNSFNSMNKSSVDYKLKNDGYGYFMHVEINSIGDNKSKVSVYHYYGMDGQKDMAHAIENWVNKDSKECVPGF